MATTGKQFYRVDIRARYQGQDIVNVLTYYREEVQLPNGTHVPLLPEQTATLCRQLATTLAGGFMYASLLTCCVTDVQFTFLRCVCLTADPSLRFGYTVDLTDTGSIMADGLPSNIAVNLSKTGSTATRRGRGWFHVGGFPQEGVADGLVLTAGAGNHYAALTALSQGIRNPVRTPGFLANDFFELLPCIVSKRDIRVFPEARYELLTRCFVRLPVRQQRSRSRGHGRRG